MTNQMGAELVGLIAIGRTVQWDNFALITTASKL
jgi:hypothetical protein